MTAQRCGYVAIIGRPNVGKSTLLNRLLGQKLSATSSKPQTTRERILGIATQGEVQMIFLDTPGWQSSPRRAAGRLANRQVRAALTSVDVIVVVFDARAWRADDDAVLQLVGSGPVLVAVANKVDLVRDKRRMLPMMALVSEKAPFKAIIPLSAQRDEGSRELKTALADLLPLRPHVFPPDQITDRSERFLAAEVIREKLMRRLGDELPYTTAVDIGVFEDRKRITHIDATIWVNRDSQRAIVVGKRGQSLKAIGTAARRDLERLLGRKVYLEIWVKTRKEVSALSHAS
jgi:GTP-binding protein Era